MTGLLKTICIFLIVYYLIKFLSRIFFPVFLQFFIKRSQRRFYTKEKKHKEGDVTIDASKMKKHKSSNSSIGEYVDFEELEDS